MQITPVHVELDPTRFEHAGQLSKMVFEEVRRVLKQKHPELDLLSVRIGRAEDLFIDCTARPRFMHHPEEWL